VAILSLIGWCSKDGAADAWLAINVALQAKPADSTPEM
jgi:hypothetical protein